MIENITEAQAKRYLTILFCRAGLDDNETEMAIDKITEHGWTLPDCVKALDTEARRYHGHKKQKIH